MEAFTFERRPVTRLEFRAPGGPLGGWSRNSLKNVKPSPVNRSAVFGRGYDCPKELRALYAACNRAMLAGEISGFWLPKELAGSDAPWVLRLELAADEPRMSRMSSVEVHEVVHPYLEVVADPVKPARRARAVKEVKRAPVVTISREVEVERPAPVTAVDLIFPPKAPTVTVSGSVVFPEALAAYLGRLVYPPKRQYAEKVARALLHGSELPNPPAKDWAEDVDRKVRKHLGKVLVSA